MIVSSNSNVSFGIKEKDALRIVRAAGCVQMPRSATGHRKFERILPDGVRLTAPLPNHPTQDISDFTFKDFCKQLKIDLNNLQKGKKK